MGLGDECEALAGQALHQPQLPQRLVRSSCWEKIRAAIRRSCSSEPGAGSAEWRTWYSRLKVGSSIQNGRPVGTGGWASFWRNRGHQVKARVDVLEQVLVARRRPLEDQTPPTCMWVEDDSLVRNETSSALSLSMCFCATANYPDALPAAPAVRRSSRGCGDGGEQAARRSASTPSAPSPTSRRRSRSARGPRARRRPRGGGPDRRRPEEPGVASRAPAPVPQRGRHHPGRRARRRRRRRPPRHQGRDPRLRRRQRRRLRGRGGARAGAGAAASPRGALGRSSSLFDAEEPRGARPFEARRHPRTPVRRVRRTASRARGRSSEIRAMVLFDLVGDCDLADPLEPNSDPGLYQRFATRPRSSTATPAPFEGTATTSADDHLPFLRRGSRRRPDRLHLRAGTEPGLTGTPPRTRSTRSAPRPRRGRRGCVRADPADPLTEESQAQLGQAEAASGRGGTDDRVRERNNLVTGRSEGCRAPGLLGLRPGRCTRSQPPLALLEHDEAGIRRISSCPLLAGPSTTGPPPRSSPAPGAPPRSSRSVHWDESPSPIVCWPFGPVPPSLHMPGQEPSGATSSRG